MTEELIEFTRNQSRLLYVDQSVERFKASVYLEASAMQHILKYLFLIRFGRDGHVWITVSSPFYPLSSLQEHDVATSFNEAFRFHGVSHQFSRDATSTTVQLHAADMRCDRTEL